MNGRARPGFRNENTQTRASKINIGFFERAKSFQTRTFSQQYISGKEKQSIVQMPDTGWNKIYVTKKKQRFFVRRGGFRISGISLSLSFSSLSPISRCFSGTNDFSILLSITTCLCIFALSSSSSMSPTYRSQSWLKLFHLNPTWKADLWFHLKAWSFSCWSLSSSKLRYFINSS